MASFRDKQKNNPLKPQAVSIPQLDPMSTLEAYQPTTQPTTPKQTEKGRKTTPKPDKKPEVKVVKNDLSEDEQVVLYAKIGKPLKQWVDHYKIDTGQELGDIVTEALENLRAEKER